jgi:hypothetical protein
MKSLPSTLIKQIIIFSFFCIAITVFAGDEISSSEGNFFYKGGIETLCKDYEVIIRIENQRIKEKNGDSKPKISSNDDISSMFRIMGAAERIGNDRLSKEIEKCIK